MAGTLLVISASSVAAEGGVRLQNKSQTRHKEIVRLQERHITPASTLGNASGLTQARTWVKSCSVLLPLL